MHPLISKSHDSKYLGKSQTFLVQNEGPGHGDHEIRVVVSHIPPKAKWSHILHAWRREKDGQGFAALTLADELRMKKMQESSKCLFWGNMIMEIESKAPN